MLMIAYFQDQIENVLTNLDSVLHEDAILKMMLLILVKENKFRGFNKVMDQEQLNTKVQELT